MNIRKLEQFVAEVFSEELQGKPVYVMAYSELDAYPELRLGGCRGWTSPFADCMSLEFLQKQGRWQGRGFATVLDSDHLDGMLDWLGIVGHELSHYLLFPPPRPIPSEELQPLALALRTDADWPANIGDLELKRPTRPSWYGHDAAFVRCGLHIWRRLHEHCEALRPQHLRLLVGPLQQMPISSWISALNSEISSTNRPVTHIITQPMPARFSELWGYISEGADCDTTNS